MKICFVTAYLGQPHGSAKSARDFARALLAVEDEVSIVSPFKENFGSELSGRHLSKPCWYRFSPKVSWKIFNPSAVLRNLRAFIQRRKIHRSLQDYHVVVNGWASYRYWKALGLEDVRSKSIIVRESPNHFVYGDRPTSQDELTSAFSEFDRLIFVSEITREFWLNIGDLGTKPAFTIHNCCEEEEISQLRRTDRKSLREKLSFDADHFVVVYPSTIEKRKGHDIVVSRIEDLMGAIPNLRLVILGDPGSEWAIEIAEKMDSGAYGSCLIRLPAVPSALKYLYAADALLFPSRAESLPRVVLEGMAFSMPIVATDVDGIPELIEHGVSGWVFSPDNSDGMIEGLKWISNNPTIAQRLGSAAERRYYKQFSRKKQFERAKSLLNWIDFE